MDDGEVGETGGGEEVQIGRRRRLTKACLKAARLRGTSVGKMARCCTKKGDWQQLQLCVDYDFQKEHSRARAVADLHPPVADPQMPPVIKCDCILPYNVYTT